ncbi:toprim domain-containing protein, partial [Geodermatophilus nigrescens]
HVTACAARVAATADAMTPTTAPAWARPVHGPDSASLRADLAVWRAGHAVPDGDRRPTGPPQPTAAARRHQLRLQEALTATTPARSGAVWAALADALDPRLRRDPHWPTLADRLAAADRAGLDAAGLLAGVAASRPLPDELPAAALWWRLAPHLTPATVATEDTGLRPDWCTTLLELLPGEDGRRVPATPAWPALVAAVATGVRGGWSAADLLAAAVAGPPPGTEDGRTAPEVAEALVFRIAALTDPAPVQAPEPLPPDLQPPDDADLVLPREDQAAAPTVAPAARPPDDSDVPLGPGHDASSPRVSSWSVTPDPVAQAATDDADYLLEQHFWATAAVGRDRLIALNTLAANFFTDSYPSSWAPGYLRERLGTDLTGDPRFNPGHAPGGWTALVDHLRRRDATDEELLAAGLAQRARTGSLIDRFRDRLIFPIRDVDGAIRGFVARRDPAASDDGRAGPKYLNTPGTDLYRKGEHLFGLHESLPALAAGAAPALVEGPLDAVALTLVGDGRTVGVAMLGTALTDRQADLLRPHVRDDGPGILVATDADAAGRRAAEAIYWQLTSRGSDPRRLVLPSGSDPADLLRGGAGQLRAAVRSSGTLAEALLAARVLTARQEDTADTPSVLREVAAVIVASPPARWLTYIDRMTEALGVPPGTVHRAVLDGGTPTAGPTARGERVPSRAYAAGIVGEVAVRARRHVPESTYAASRKPPRYGSRAR